MDITKFKKIADKRFSAESMQRQIQKAKAIRKYQDEKIDREFVGEEILKQITDSQEEVKETVKKFKIN